MSNKLPTAEQLLSDTYKKHGWRYQPNIVGGCPHEHIALEAMQEYSDQQNAELREQLASEIESREHWQRQTQRYQKYHRELNAALERVKELEAENEKLRKISDGYALLYEDNERLKSELEEKMTQKTVDCPMCLFSSGTVANGRGTKCSACNGTGRIRKSVYIKLRNIYGDLIR